MLSVVVGHQKAWFLLRNLRCAIRFCTLRLSFVSVMDDQSSSANPSDVCVSFDWDVLGLRYDMLLPPMVYRVGICCDLRTCVEEASLHRQSLLDCSAA
jgi:hypothetical protein